MKLIFRNLILSNLFILFSMSSALATQIVVSEGYVRETIPGTKISSAYMVLENTSDKDATLVGASSDVSERVEIHEHIMADGMMRMQQVESLIIKANSKVVFQPSGYHLMIFNLQQRLKAGENASFTLHFSNIENITVKFPVHSIKKMQHQHH